MEIDKDKILKFLYEIQGNAQKLKEIHKKGKDEFVNDYILHNAALRLLQISIEGMISVGSHIIARQGLKNPKNFAEVFKILAEANIIKHESAKVYQTMARFRNRIVHLYWNIDLNEVYNILENNLTDFEKFIKEITDQFLKESNNNDQ